MFHEPILVETFLSFYDQREIKLFIDGTVGAGGHAKALLERHPEIETLFAIDQDTSALAIAAETLHPFREKVRFIQGNFRNIKELVPKHRVDGIFLDIGVSSMQLDQGEKGFSFYKEGPLDMRMDQTLTMDAADVVNTFSEKELGTIFRELGEERRWRRAAKAIVEGRKKRKIITTFDLTEILKYVLTWGGRKGRIHPMTLVFQALRIFVNDELGALKEGLEASVDVLASGGRLGVISFHSLEDRIVKTYFRQAALENKVQLLTKKPLIAESGEIRHNPRSRSAKMRFVEKVIL